MKARIAVIFMFAMLFGTQLHAQSLLEKNGHMVENSVKNDIKKKINKKSQNIIDSTSDVNEQEKSSTSAPSSSSVKVTNGAPGREVDSPFVFAGGTGTFEDPYLIQTAHQLNAVRKGLASHYKLIADIDLSEWGNWIPIGSDASYGCLRNAWNKEKGTGQFMGTFDGNGHVVSGMQIVICQETPYQNQNEKINAHLYGLFSTLATSPTRHQLKNLGVVNFKIDIKYVNLFKSVELYAGGITGGINDGFDIVNCYTKGGKIDITVIGNEKFSGYDDFGRLPDGTPTAEIYVGGICPQVWGACIGRDTHTHIERCYNDSDITISANRVEMYIRAGGITGTMDTSHIHECFNNGNITIPMRLDNLDGIWSESVAGGICATASIPNIPGIYHKGTEESSFIQNCYNTGAISAKAASGIFFESSSDIHLENCYNIGHIDGNEIDHAMGYDTITAIICKGSNVVKFGAEYIRKCYSNGNSVSGSAWKVSSALGRKVLAQIPEDTHPGNRFNVDPGIIGSFSDVKGDAWYANVVQWALDRGIISDASATTFSPDKACTRAQLITMLWRAAGSPGNNGVNPFLDVKESDSHYAAALWAAEKGIVSGSSFVSGTSVTRSEFVISLWKSLDSPESKPTSVYTDVHHSTELGKAASWGFYNGIIGGTDSHKFSAAKTLTKAQVLTYLKYAIK